MSDLDSQQLQEDLRQALEVIRLLDARVEELSAARTDARFRPDARGETPIAIVAMACRLPGGIEDPEAYWELLRTGSDAVGPFPQRWQELDIYDEDPDAAGKCYARQGGFLRQIEDFDSGFFGISAREAQGMEPQQRLVLETAWEALERAGIVPARLSGSRTGVYLGAGQPDFGRERPGLDSCDGYMATGRATSVLSGRVAYTLGFTGPALTIDTACSSSLVALHLACNALRQRECDMALAGGAMVMSTPIAFVEFSRLRGLSKTGRCRSFSAQADGIVWSEGCGMLVLKRLPDAQRDGNPVLAVVRGSAVNQDGRSQGLTAPNGPSQQRVILEALAASSLKPAEIDMLEAHGTGTPLGDPIEAGALAEVFGPERDPARPLYLGSSKSNLGHAQAAAGVASVMKLVLSLQHELMPKTLHAELPSVEIDWEDSGLSLLTDARPWPRGERVRRGAVSSFGMSGTNAHAIIEEAPAGPEPARERDIEASEPAAERVPLALPLVLSGLDEAALRAQAARWADFLSARPRSRLSDIVHTAACNRSHFAVRACVTAADIPEAVAGLSALAEGASRTNLLLGGTGVCSGADPRTATERGKIVFVFPGQGSQWCGMGRALLRQSSTFLASVRACDAALRPLTGWSVLALLAGEEAASLPPFDRVDAVQPALFAVSLGLAALWRSLGIEPKAVIGHSQGEVAAAVVAGALSLEDAARVVALRSQAVHAMLCSRADQRNLAEGAGAMLVIERPLTEVERYLAPFGQALSVAAVNTASSTIVSGDPAAAEELMAELQERRVFCRKIKVDYASHTAQMDALLPGLCAGLACLAPRTPDIPFYSTVTGGPLPSDQLLDADYWCRNLRQTVRFDRALEQLLADAHDVLIEVSPHPVLAMPLTQACAHGRGVAVASLSRDRPELSAFYRSLGELYVNGVAVDWEKALPVGAHVPALPTYAFQRQRCWLEPSARRADVAALGLTELDHPWLLTMSTLADGDGYVFSGRVSLREHPWLSDHAVHGTVLLPGTAMLELALCAARAVGERGISELTLEQPLVLTDAKGVQLQISVAADDDSAGPSIRIHSRTDGGDGIWLRHATGRLSSGARAEHDLDFEILRSWPVEARERSTDGWTPLELDGFYGQLSAGGLQYGPSFQGLAQLWRAGDAVYGRIVLPRTDRQLESYGIHPALLDAALHTLAAALPADDGSERALLPFAWSDVELFATGARELRVRVRLEQEGSLEQATASLQIADAAGAPVMRVGGLTLRRLQAEQLRSPQSRVQHLYRVDFQPLSLEPAAPPLSHSTVVLGGRGDLARRLRSPSYADLPALLSALDRGASAPERLLVDATQVEPPRALAHEVHAITAEGLRVLQDWLTDPRLQTVELVWVTSHAVSTGPENDADDLAHAPLWGLLRSARSEHPGRALRLVDLGYGEIDVGELERMIACRSEPELVWRNARVLAPRLGYAQGSGDVLEPPVGASSYRLDIREKGRLDTLYLRDQTDLRASQTLAAHEARVAVRAASMNFRDVLNALDMVPAPQLGLECAGVVIEVGAAVRHIAPGDRVMGLGLGTFGTDVRVDARMFVRVPAGLSFAQAATVPLAYLTALYALQDLGGLRAGDKILIHAATGGVGLAALALARRLGAEVYATASPGKWHALRARGLTDAQIASSRDLQFERRWLAQTGGEGFDVVLNSLARDYVDASLRLLPRGGRFLEMGKTDVRDPAELAAAHPDVAYHTFDLKDVHPERIGELLSQLSQLLASGEIEPLPFVSYDVRHAPVAFRLMAQARHVGRLVLMPPAALDPNGSVLLTGGTGELGQAVAEHLLRAHGVRHLILTSRRGLDGPGARELVERLYASGAASVQVLACDVSQRSDVERALKSVSPAHPLTGVLHLAGVLDDGMLLAQTPERLARVLMPKMDGAWHLHELTADLELSAFVLFSAAAGTFGNAGQTSYGAANAFLDALAAQRRARGLAGQSLAWGLWEQQGQGMTRSLSEVELRRLEIRGVSPLSVADGLRLLDAALARPEAGLVPVRLELARLQKMQGDRETPALLRKLVRPGLRKATAGGEDAPALRTRLLALPEAGRLSALLELVQAEVAAVLRLAEPHVVEPERELRKLGLDSLTAVELRNRLATRVAASLPSTLAFDYPSPAAIARMLAETMQLRQPELKAPRLQLTREELRGIAEQLVSATPQQLAALGLVDGLLKLRAQGHAALPESEPEETVEQLDRRALMRFVDELVVDEMGAEHE